MDCIFCKIISGEIPSSKIYEDDKVLAFLDIKPVNFGHILVIPKEHYPTFIDLPDELIKEIFTRAKKLIPAIKQAMAADFIVLSVVGIEVLHFHLHLIPRYFNDGLANFWPTKKYGEGEIQQVADKIKILTV